MYPSTNCFKVYFDRPPLQAVISCEVISSIMSVSGLKNVSIGRNDFRWSETIGGQTYVHTFAIPTGNYLEDDLAAAV
jgi:hypothetical protein